MLERSETISNTFDFTQLDLIETSQKNNWQKLSEATNSIVTPANIIDAVGFIGAKYGMDRIDTPKGALITVASYGADVIDGKIARATGTQSELGEIIDATGDKIKLGYGIYTIWQKSLADKPLLALIATQNIINASLALTDRKINGKNQAIHPSVIGKRGFFLQQVGLGTNILGKKMDEKGYDTGETIKRLGNVIGFTGVALGSIASVGYFRMLKKSSKNK